MNPHKVDNKGDFLRCTVPNCIWGATWSLGHICNHCRLHRCRCPCPLTKEWLEQNKEQLGFRKIQEYIASEKSSEEWFMNHRKENGERLAGKFHHQTLGKLDFIEKLYELVPQLKMD